MPFVIINDYIFISDNKHCIQPPECFSTSTTDGPIVTKLHPGLHAPASRGFAGLGRGKIELSGVQGLE